MLDFTFGPLDPFVFSRAFSAKSPVSSGAQHLSAAATRICFSVLFGLLAVPESLWAEASALFTAHTLWGLSLVVGAWLVATIIGGPVGVAIDALILGYGLYELWPVVKKVAGDLWEWLRTSYWANNEQDLKQAGQHFADALGAGGMAALEAIVLHKAFSRASKSMLEHFPVPEWLEHRFKNVEAQRQKRAADEPGKRAADEPSKRAADDTEGKRNTSLEKRLHSAAGRVLVPAGQGVGDFPTGLVLGGTLVLVVAGTGIALLASGSKK